MKTRIIILSLFMTLCSIFSACENEAVDITTAVDITINTSSVLSPFTLYDSSDLDMISDSKVRLTCLLYNANGSLVDRQDIALSDFSSSTTIQEKLTDQTYTLVVVASCVRGGSLVKPEYEAYSLIGVDNLSTLTIEQVLYHAYNSSVWSVLGYGKQVFMSQNNNETVMNLEPATALVYLNYRSIHTRPNIDKYRIEWISNNQLTFNKGDVRYACSLESGTVAGYYELEPDSYSDDAVNLYTIYNILPGECTINSAPCIGNNYFDIRSANTSLEAGHQYVFRYDCSAATLTIKEGRL